MKVLLNDDAVRMKSVNRLSEKTGLEWKVVMDIIWNSGRVNIKISQRCFGENDFSFLSVFVIYFFLLLLDLTA